MGRPSLHERPAPGAQQVAGLLRHLGLGALPVAVRAEGGALASLLVAPEWHLWIAALALLSIGGLAWTPLLLAVPVLLVALGLTLAASAARAARAPSVIRPTGRGVRMTRWALATFLHLLQPLARSSGRLARARSARSRPSRFAVPLPRVLREWTEAWQPGERRLNEIEE